MGNCLAWILKIKYQNQTSMEVLNSIVCMLNVSQKGVTGYFWNSTKELLIWVIICELGLRGFMSHLAIDTWINLATSLAYFYTNPPSNDTNHCSLYMVPSWKFINVQWDSQTKCIRYVKTGYWFWKKLFKKVNSQISNPILILKTTPRPSQVRAELRFIYIYIQGPT